MECGSRRVYCHSGGKSSPNNEHELVADFSNLEKTIIGNIEKILYKINAADVSTTFKTVLLLVLFYSKQHKCKRPHIYFDSYFNQVFSDWRMRSWGSSSN